MAISEKLKGFTQSMQEGVRTTTVTFAQSAFRAITGAVIGLTVALIGQELFGYGTFAFVMMIIVVLTSIYNILAKWSIAHILIFDLICVLIAALLRMYILIAP